MWARALFGRGALPLFPCRRGGPSVLTHNTGGSYGCRKLIGKRGVTFCHFGHFSSPRAWNRPCAPREQNEAFVQRCVDHLPILADFTFDFSSRSEVWQHFANFVNVSPEKEYPANVCKLLHQVCKLLHQPGILLKMLAKCCHVLLLDEKSNVDSAERAGDPHTSGRGLPLISRCAGTIPRSWV